MTKVKYNYRLNVDNNSYSPTNLGQLFIIMKYANGKWYGSRPMIKTIFNEEQIYVR